MKGLSLHDLLRSKGCEQGRQGKGKALQDRALGLRALPTPIQRTTHFRKWARSHVGPPPENRELGRLIEQLGRKSVGSREYELGRIKVES